MHKLLPKILNRKIISIIRGVGTEGLAPAVEALLRGGVDFVELTFDAASEENSLLTLEGIRMLREKFGTHLHVGAGTVLTPRQVELAAEAGAEFIISPNMNASVIARTGELGLLSMPGAFTPTEVEAAAEAGADIIKIFPAGTVGPAYFKALKAPLSHVRLAAVGGVSEDNICAFLNAGADAFGIGGFLVSRERVSRGAWDEIEASARAYVEKCKIKSI